jgi:dihydrofolate reductase
MITLIVARARNGAIGKDNTIPWHAPEDLRFFQRETLGGAIIMGRHTWESLPLKPLKNRMNLVVSSKECSAEFQFASPQDAINAAVAAGYMRIYGIGGNQIYRAMLPLADRLLLTEVDLVVKDADTFFPEFEANDWVRAGRSEIRTEAPKCAVDEYLRRRVSQ